MTHHARRETGIKKRREREGARVEQNEDERLNCKSKKNKKIAYALGNRFKKLWMCI